MLSATPLFTPDWSGAGASGFRDCAVAQLNAMQQIENNVARLFIMQILHCRQSSSTLWFGSRNLECSTSYGQREWHRDPCCLASRPLGLPRPLGADSSRQTPLLSLFSFDITSAGC